MNMNWKKLVARQSRKLNSSYKAWKRWWRRKERRELKKQVREDLIYALHDYHSNSKDLMNHIDERMTREKFISHFWGNV